jgi:hypothetical protein
VLGAGGALILSAALWPAEAWAQATGSAKKRIGVIGSGRIGGTIGGRLRTVLFAEDGACLSMPATVGGEREALDR